MGLVPNFTAADIRKRMDKALEKIDKRIILRMSYLGEQCVKEARSLDTYEDQTSNLRNSLGYVLLKDGEIIKADIEYFSGSKAEEIVEKRKSKYPKGYALIVVAGMEYADYVEAKGYVVLSSAEALAEKEMPIMIAKLKQNIKSAANG